MKPTRCQTNYSPDQNADTVYTSLLEEGTYFDLFYGLNHSGQSGAQGGNFSILSSQRSTANDVWQEVDNSLMQGLWANFKPYEMMIPYRISIAIRFAGVINGNISYSYTKIFTNNYKPSDIYNLFVAKTDTTTSFTHQNRTFKLADFLNGPIYRDDTGVAVGFYFLTYSFQFARNRTSTGAVGNYSLPIPMVGYFVNNEDEANQCPSYLTSYRQTEWAMYGIGQSAPYGDSNRPSWGPGIRTNSSSYPDVSGLYIDVNSALSEGIYTNYFYYSNSSNGSASKLITSYFTNLQGWNGKAPLVDSIGAYGVAISSWTEANVRAYYEKWSSQEVQKSLFLPEGRYDFCNLIPLVTGLDIWHHMSLYPVWTELTVNDNTYPQQNANFWFAEVSNSNEFMGNLIRGNDPDLADKVPDWILQDDSSLNTYDSDDKPEPGGGDQDEDDPSTEPEADGKGEAPIYGDSVYQIVSRVGTEGSERYYILRGIDAAKFLQLLWQQPKTFYQALQMIGTSAATSIFDYISSFTYYPCTFDTLSIGSDLIGNLSPIYLGTGAQFTNLDGTQLELNHLNRQTFSIPYCEWNLGSLGFGFRNNFLDMNPYSKLTITLPYAGTYELDLASVAAVQSLSSTTIYLRVAFDLISGTLSYYIYSYPNDTLLLTKTIKIGVDISLSGNNAAQQAAQMLLAGNAAGSRLLNGVSSIGSSISKGNLLGVVSEVAQLPLTLSTSYVETSLASRQIPVTAGSFGGTYSTIFEIQTPFLTYYRPRVANPSNYGHTIGYLWEGTAKISTLTGYTVCRNVDLRGINGTEEELNELKQILETGFYA